MLRQVGHPNRIVRRRRISASLHSRDALRTLVARPEELAALRREYAALGASDPGARRRRSVVAHERAQRAVQVERERMARELHDTVGQAFTAILVQVCGLRETARETPELVAPALDQLHELAQLGLAETHRVAHALRPPALDGTDLATALRRTVVQVTLGSPLDVDITLRGSTCPLPPSIEAQVLRIAQEAVTNTLKHAGAHRLGVELRVDAGSLHLRIDDDGRGFDPAAPCGDGLRNMRERAAALGATLSITSAAGRGTTVALAVPLTAGGSDAP